MIYILSFIAGWVLGVVSVVIGGFVMYKTLQEAVGGVSEQPKVFKKGFLGKVERKVESMVRRPAVFVSPPTKKTIEKIKKEEEGWGEFNDGIAKPASEEDEDDDD